MAQRLLPTFSLVRVIGNDLPPRHAVGQSLANIQFILKHEPPFPDCRKHWLLNRIVDPEAEARIIDLLEETGQSYSRIPFSLDAYAAVDWDVEAFQPKDFLHALGEADGGETRRRRAEERIRYGKNNYVVNNNGARNEALRLGRNLAEWTIPLDGQCILSLRAYSQLRRAAERADLRYIVIPMARAGRRFSLWLRLLSRLSASEEPQLAFHRAAQSSFDERHPYGRRPKVDLLKRIGVPGSWDRVVDDPWDIDPKEPSSDAGRFVTAGRVIRLPSGNDTQEKGRRSARRRRIAREDGVVKICDQLDQAAIARHWSAGRLWLYDEAAIERVRTGSTEAAARLRDQIIADATTAIDRGLFSVLDKSGVAASGDRRDYFSQAPYWWPAEKAGAPSIRRDGERLPSTKIGNPGSERFDSTAMHRVLAGSTVSALAWRLTGEDRFAIHGAALLRRWFVDADTRMNPNLSFAQVRPGHASNQGNGTGILEFRDIVSALDGVRILSAAGAWSVADDAALKDWLHRYVDWLETSEQGREERTARNNHGTFFDVQTLAIALYRRDFETAARAVRRARVRLHFQFEATGEQPLEASRAHPDHYAGFNLIGWAMLCAMTARIGQDLHRRLGSDGRGLLRGLQYLAEGGGLDSGQQPSGGQDFPVLAAFGRVYLDADIQFPAATGTSEMRDVLPPLWPLFDARYLD